MAKETNLGVWTLFVLLFPLVYADSTSVRVTRDKEEPDSFRLPQSFEWCSLQNECNRFNANLSLRARKRGKCWCSCSRQKPAATFGVKTGYWQCVDNKEIHQRELSGKLVNVLVYLLLKSLVKFLLTTRKSLCSNLPD